MHALLDEVVRRSGAGERLAVCLVVRTRGSTPQKPGAMMLVLQSGQSLGTLGGGCVEAEVRTRAMSLILRGEDRLLTFKLDSDYGWDDGLVCGGTMEIAIQTLRTREEAEPYRVAAESLKQGRPAAVAFDVPDAEGEPFHVEQRFEPAAKLVVAGAGHVGAALAEIASPLGFEVTVVDDRADCASETRFPRATRIVGPIEQELGRLALGENCYVVIVTRGHRHDADALRAVVRSSARYVGLIGSKRKILTILRELRAEGVEDRQLARVHAPIGLSIGAVMPEEIAISIAAELIAVRRGAEVAGQAMRIDPTQLDRLLGAREA